VELIARRFRGVIIALVVLGLSASVAFAGHLTLAPTSQPTTSEQGDQDEQATENDESSDADEDSGDAAAGNHGAVVSMAAMMDTPVAAEGEEGFKNHGAFVSCVAHMKDDPVLAEGQTLADFLGALTPADCTAGDEDATEAEAEAEDAEGDAFNHGALVSAAAQMETPVAAAGETAFANHGEFVSCVAKMRDVPAGMTVEQVLAGVTATTCAAADQARADAKAAAKADKVRGKSADHKGKGRGHKHD
jgi:hypothetical protein